MSGIGVDAIFCSEVSGDRLNTPSHHREGQTSSKTMGAATVVTLQEAGVDLEGARGYQSVKQPGP